MDVNNLPPPAAVPVSSNFQIELGYLLNRYSQENGSNTPDFILAQYLKDCLDAWNKGVQRREEWYGRPILKQPLPLQR